MVGNGSNELLELLGHVFLRPGDEVVMGAPAFIVYKLVALLFGARPVEVPLVEHRHDLEALARAVTPRTKLVFLPSPNNPTGTANTEAEIHALVRGLPEQVVFVFDEAYAEYLDNPPICGRCWPREERSSACGLFLRFSASPPAGWLWLHFARTGRPAQSRAAAL